MTLDERLRAALHDLDDRTHTVIAERPLAPPVRTRRFVPVLAGLAVTALLIGVVGLTGADHVTIAPATDRRPSQSAADAARDLVLPDIAALPLSVRLAPIEPRHRGIPTELSTPEGIWTISSPDISSIVGHCPNPSPTYYPGGSSSQSGTCVMYTEILLLSPDRQHIRRAFPIADYPPQWLSLTPDAIYCGRQDGIRSMVCRIDRSTQTLVGRIFPAAKPVFPEDIGNSVMSQEFPGSWTTQKPSTLSGFDQAELTSDALQIRDDKGEPTVRLDPHTLEPLR